MDDLNSESYFRTLSNQGLVDVARALNRQKFPIRWEILLKELESRGLTDPLSASPNAGDYVPREIPIVDAHEAIWQAIQKLQKKPAEEKRKFGFLLITFASLALFGVIQSSTAGIEFVIMILVALTIHEMGHVIAMKLFGYRDVGILFIPFFGALAKGVSDEYDARKQCVVSLAGPVAGLIGGIAALVSYRITPAPFLLKFAHLSIGLNVLNLLPFWPLDGGRFFQETIFSRNPILALGFSGLSAAGLFFLGIKTSDLIMVYFSIGVFVGSFTKLRWNLVVERIRKRVVVSENTDLNLKCVAEIYEQVVSEFPEMWREEQPKKLAGLVLNLWKQSKKTHPSWMEVGVILVGSAATIGILIVALRLVHP